MNTTPDSPFGQPLPGGTGVPALARRSFLAGSLGLAAAGFLAACGSSSTSPSGSGSGGGGSTPTSMVVAVAALVTDLDGTIDGTGTYLQAYEMNANLNAGLVHNPYISDPATAGTVIQNFNKYEGLVAESYEVNSAGTLYTFHLRKGLKSAMGNPITADDVVYSFQRKYAQSTFGSSIFGTAFAGPKAIKKLDDYTVTFTMTQPGFGETFLGILANATGHIWDSKLLKSHATSSDPWALKWSAANGGWGLGPYYVSSQTPDQEMVLTANPNFALGKPSIETVTLRLETDPGTRASLVVQGSVQAAEDILATDQNKLLSNSAVVVPRVKDPIAYVDLTLVCNKAPFNDVKVRQAFQYALPYAQIMSQIYPNSSTYKIGNINPTLAGYTIAGLPKPTTDIAKSKALLQEAGQTSVPVTISVSTANPDLVNALVLVKSAVSDAGFDVTIKQMAAEDFQTARVNGTEQAIIYLNRAQVQTAAYSCTVFFKPDNNTANPSRWQDAQNTEFWGYVNKALAIQDQSSPAAGKLYNEAQKIMIEAAAEIFVCAIQPTQIYSSKLEGFAYRSENANDFSSYKYAS